MVDKKLSEFDEVSTGDVSFFPVLDASTKNGKLAATRAMPFTNCITDIPQDIKLELISGTITLKAGSKVYFPNGNSATTSADRTYTYALGTEKRMLFYNTTGYSIAGCGINKCFSGSTAPSSSGTIYWYDTTNNLIKRSDNGGSTWSDAVYTLPIAIVNAENGVITSIDKVFNGFGYIGSTIFALPGISGLYPDGRNSDGTIKNGKITTSSLITTTITSTGIWKIVLTSTGMNRYTNVFYDPDRNIFWNSSNPQITRIFCGTVTTETGGKITDFNLMGVFRAIGYYDLEQTNKSLSELSSNVSSLDSNNMKLSGDQTAGGNKTFTGTIISTNSGAGVPNNVLAVMTARSSGNFSDLIGLYDTANNCRCATIRAFNTAAEHSLLLGVNSFNDGPPHGINIAYDSSNNLTITGKTPSSATDNSTQLSTTAWIHTFLTTNDADAFSTWTKAAKGGFKLANGLIVNWGRATAVTNTFAVPFSSNTSYSISVAVAGTEQGATSWGQVNTLTSTGFKAVGASSSRTIYWLAIGY